MTNHPSSIIGYSRILFPPKSSSFIIFELNLSMISTPDALFPSRKGFLELFWFGVSIHDDDLSFFLLSLRPSGIRLKVDPCQLLRLPLIGILRPLADPNENWISVIQHGHPPVTGHNCQINPKYDVTFKRSQKRIFSKKIELLRKKYWNWMLKLKMVMINWIYNSIFS